LLDNGLYGKVRYLF